LQGDLLKLVLTVTQLCLCHRLSLLSLSSPAVKRGVGMWKRIHSLYQALSWLMCIKEAHYTDNGGQTSVMKACPQDRLELVTARNSALYASFVVLA